MKWLFLVLVGVSLQSCLTVARLNGNYPTNIVWHESGKSYDELFDRIMDWVVEEGYEMSVLNKEAGYIELNVQIPYNYITPEQRNNKQLNSNAYAVLASGSTAIFDSYGRVLIRLKNVGNDKREIGIKMEAYAYETNGKDRYKSYSTIHSLGNFEHQLLDKLTK